MKTLFRSALRVSSVALVGFFSGSLPAHVNAQDSTSNDVLAEELIVTASRVPRAVHATGSSVAAFDAQAISARGTPFISDVLREVPGVAVNRAGGNGGLTQVRLRGAEGNHTLVMIDGIETNDPAFGSEFNFAALQTTGIDRMEVLRGPQSALYGSDAIGGVISFMSDLPDADESGINLDVAAGSQATTRGSISAAAGTDRLRGAVHATRYRTAGFSASPIGDERDGATSRTVHGIGEVDLTEGLTARVVLRDTKSRVEEDEQDFDFPPAPTQGLVIDSRNATAFRQRHALAELRHALSDERFRQRLAMSWLDTSNHFIDAGRTNSASAGNRRKFDYDATFAVHAASVTHTFTAGVQHELLRFRNRALDFTGADQNRDDEQTSGIFEYGIDIDDQVSLGLAARHDWNKRFDDATTWRATAAWQLTDSGTRLHASYGEGIANPGFFELFGFIPESFAGNPGLQPEGSKGYDAGIEQHFADGRLSIDVTAFAADLTDEITTEFDFNTFVSSPINLSGESRRKGIEVTARAALTPALNLTAAWGYVDAEDRDDRREIRRPEHTASGSLDWRFADERAQLHVTALYNGEQRDAEFIFATPEDRATLNDYVLVNIAASFAITEAFKVYARLENAFDEDYAELFGFRSPGRSGWIGVEVSVF